MFILSKKVNQNMADDKLKIERFPIETNPTKAKILMTEFVTHDVKRFVIEKPKGYEFLPGQATLLSIPQPEWEKKFREFSFTSTTQDEVLEFTIKEYPDHNGFTKKIHSLRSGDEILLHPPFGTIQYKGKGVFLAGGAGITPFISILRQLHKNNQLNENILLFSNKEIKDVMLEKELRQMFGDNLILTLTREHAGGYQHGRINREMIEKYVKDLNQKFYICGPDPFVLELKKTLESMGVKEEDIIAESFIVSG